MSATCYRVRKSVLTVQKKLHPEVLEYWSIGVTKNSKQITMTKIQNTKPVWVIWYWNLRFVCNLVLGV